MPTIPLSELIGAMQLVGLSILRPIEQEHPDKQEDDQD